MILMQSVSQPERARPGRPALSARKLFPAGLLLAAVFGLVSPVAAQQEKAESASTPVSEIIDLLTRVQAASQELDYSGVYTHQNNGALVSSRIVHVVDGTGERERLEILDGLPREYLTHNDVTQCLIPEQQVVIRQKSSRDRFPALLLAEPERIPGSYSVKLDTGRDRIAGRECRETVLVPLDDQRYGYRLCTDVKNDLLLRLQTMGPGEGVLEQIVFTSLDTGDAVEHELLESGWDTSKWHVIEAPRQEIDLAARGWRIFHPPGFQPVRQVSRPISETREVSQLVLSDGVAAISVFIEPLPPEAGDVVETRLMTSGAVNILRTRIGNHWLTALGEVPALALRGIAERTEYVPLGGAD